MANVTENLYDHALSLGQGAGPEPLLNEQQRLQDARTIRIAFNNKDAEASKAAHQARHLHNQRGGMYDETPHDEQHNTASGDYIKAFVFGGLDGIVTIFAIVAGCVGANLSPLSTIIVALGNLFADAFSMGFGEYVSSSTEDDYIKAEKAKEEWEVENCPEEEKQEMTDIYIQKYGFSREDAWKFVEIGFKYKDFFIEHMMVEELGLMVGSDGPTAVQKGVVMFVSFCVFGVVPLVGFVFIDFLLNRMMEGPVPIFLTFGAASLLSLITLFILGYFKGNLVNQNCWKSGFLMLINGGFAGSVAYLVGYTLEKFFGGSVAL